MQVLVDLSRHSAGTLLIFFLSAISLISVQFYGNVLQTVPIFTTQVRKSTENVTKKYILAWTRWSWSSHDFDRNPVNWFDGCPESRCVMGSKRERHADADAIIFYMPNFYQRDIPPQYARKPNQYYIFHILESPDTTKELVDFRKWDTIKDFFNITFTYRFDSDVFDGHYLNQYEPHLIDTSKRDTMWFYGRRDILWMVSHCQTKSKREAYVQELKKFVHIDVIGKCDGMGDPCDKGKCAGEGDIMAKYKFYLSFENSICKYYATEKLFRALNNDVVPVVMGGFPYKKFLPPKAVIDVADYQSPEHLAKYLKYLLTNASAYEEHLSWKYKTDEAKAWVMPGVPRREKNGFCQLCEYLHRPPVKRIYSTYYRIVKWWFKGQCLKSYENLLKNNSLYKKW